MAVLPDYATYDADAGTLAIVFDGELYESADISTAGFSAVLPTAKRAIFGTAGVADNDGGIGTLTFAVTEGGGCGGSPHVRYGEDQAHARVDRLGRLARLTRL